MVTLIWIIFERDLCQSQNIDIYLCTLTDHFDFLFWGLVIDCNRYCLIFYALLISNYSIYQGNTFLLNVCIQYSGVIVNSFLLRNCQWLINSWNRKIARVNLFLVSSNDFYSVCVLHPYYCTQTTNIKQNERKESWFLFCVLISHLNR